MSEQRLEAVQSQKLSQSVQTAISLLSLDLYGVSDYLLKSIQENPALEYVPPIRSPQDYAARVRARETQEPARPVTMMEDLEQQLRLSGLSADVLRAAAGILHQLNPRGYFLKDLTEFAAEERISKETAKEALAAVQALEPTGIGARSVEECLRLQLDQREADPLCYDLIQVHLLDIGKGNLRQIAKETGAEMARIKTCVDTIRSLNPVPCSLSEGNTVFVMPEFSVEIENGEPVILFNNEYFPVFRQDNNFKRLSETLTGEEQRYARALLDSANQLVQAIQMRQSTMEKLAGIIVREQRAFFLGQYSLLPMRCDAVAAEMEVHESTVYRAIQGKYLSCPRGTFALSHFFQREMSEGVSQERVKEMIRELTKNARLSDQKIADQLLERGIKISRRTVAKYRAQMEIDSSFLRN